MGRLKLISAIVVALLLGLANPAPAKPAMAVAHIYIERSKLLVEIPHTLNQRYTGLSGRKGLKRGNGMAFVHAEDASPVMTMRGMRFALDFIWARAGKVVQVTANVPYEGGDKTDVTAGQPVDLVIEVPAGWARAHKVKAGSPIKLIGFINRVRNADTKALQKNYAGLHH